VNSIMKCSLAFASALMVAGSAGAQGSASAALEPKAPDPSEIVCQKIEMIGSRLSVKKVCMTRSQWADSRRQDREAVERAQASPCVLTHNGGGGKPSC
jgi:hypothetical protein